MPNTNGSLIWNNFQDQTSTATVITPPKSMYFTGLNVICLMSGNFYEGRSAKFWYVDMRSNCFIKILMLCLFQLRLYFTILLLLPPSCGFWMHQCVLMGILRMQICGLRSYEWMGQKNEVVDGQHAHISH